MDDSATGLPSPQRPALTAVYVDFQSPACGRVWRWLSAAGVRRRVEVRPFWMESRMPAVGGGGGPWERARPTSGLELLALGEFARDRGFEQLLSYVDAAFAALAEDHGERSGLEALLALGAQAGLDLDAFTEESERWRAEVGLWHREAEDELGVDGVPTLLFGRQHALRVELGREVDEPAEAAAVLEQLRAIAAGPVREVRRTSG